MPDQQKISSSLIHNFGRKNLVHNGAMYIDQRNRGAAATPANATAVFGPDRFYMYKDTAATFTIDQDTESPDGFKHSLKVTNTGTDSSISATDRAMIVHRIEGQDIIHLGLGTSSAATVTLSFYVRSSITGTHGGALRNHDSSQRNYPFTYTISSANTWERKTLTITLDTSGTWPSDNTVGLQIQFGLGVGSTFSGTAGAWADGDKNSATGATTGMLSTSSATWYVTGIQLEVGDTATDFEHKSYADYEWDCQRYYHAVKEGSGAYMIFTTGRAWGTGGANGPYKFPRVMRATPTMTAGGAAGDYDFGISAVPSSGSVTLNNDMMVINVSGSFTVGQIIVIGSNAGGSGPAELKFDAELD